MTARVLRRLWPASLFGRLAWIFLIGLVTAHALSFWLVFMERGMAARSMMGSYLARDVASSVAILERVPAGERAAWLPRLERRHYRFLLGPQQPAAGIASARAQQFGTVIEEALGPGYRVQASDPADAAAQIRLQLLLADGSPLTLELSEPAMPVSAWVLAVLALQLALLLLLTWYAVRLATRPLQRLADAADALSPGAPTAPLHEEGPQEVVQAARALNALQQRIATHLAERMQILAAVSHDLQTPLTRMRLRADLLDDSALRGKLQGDLDAMQALVQEGMAYARSAHSAQEAPVRLRLHALLDSMACDYRDAGQPVRMTDVPDLTIQTRPHALRRIVGNLVDNALKFAGEAEITVATARDGAVSIGVLDRGAGIPEDKLEAVCKPFYRLEHSRNRDTGGTGLGLAIAQQLATAMNGRLRLVNRTGGGLAAWLDLNSDA
ncbi:MAG: two-component sensor histidine kinase [Polaromonas sp.]|nr:two-component sensor histidine kinase [Polaromonas sp.]